MYSKVPKIYPLRLFFNILSLSITIQKERQSPYDRVFSRYCHFDSIVDKLLFSGHDIKILTASSVSLKTPKTKFEGTPQEDVERETF